VETDYHERPSRLEAFQRLREGFRDDVEFIIYRYPQSLRDQTKKTEEERSRVQLELLQQDAKVTLVSYLERPRRGMYAA